MHNVRELEERGVIVPVPAGQCRQGFYSHIFVVPKPSGRYCLIINLKRQNTFLRYKRFYVESVYTLRKHLLKDVFMITIGILQDYLHDIPIIGIGIECIKVKKSFTFTTPLNEYGLHP